MARPIKQGVDCFPVWQPQQCTIRKMHSHDFKVRYKAIRNSSSGFIKKESVRNLVFLKDNFKCQICGSNDNLTVDHIESVYKAAKGKLPIDKLNVQENLRTLCRACNERRTP